MGAEANPNWVHPGQVASGIILHPCPFPHICRKPSGLKVGTHDSSRRQCVSWRVCCQCCGFWGDAEEERFCRWLDLLSLSASSSPPRLPSSCHCANTSVFLRSSVEYREHPLSLSPSLCWAAVEGPGTIEADGCAWQNYWDVQPKYKWHSPLKSLPRSQAC